MRYTVALEIDIDADSAKDAADIFCGAMAEDYPWIPLTYVVKGDEVPTEIIETCLKVAGEIGVSPAVLPVSTHAREDTGENWNNESETTP